MMNNARCRFAEKQTSAVRSQDIASPEAGSVYVLTLLVLVVLTIVGMSVALSTQSEFVIGGAERSIHRVFYAADSGIAASTSRALVNADFAARTIEIAEEDSPLAFGAEQTVDLSPFFPLLEAPCNLCEINNVGSYSDRSYKAINYVITANAARRSIFSSAALSEGTVGAMVEVMPWKSPTEAYLAVTDQNELNKIKF